MGAVTDGRCRWNILPIIGPTATGFPLLGSVPISYDRATASVGHAGAGPEVPCPAGTARA
jgi:hypothetical protein